MFHKEFTGKSGAKIQIAAGAFKDAITLKNAIEKEMINSGKGSMGEAFMLIDSSETVYRATFSCLERCLYNNEKITEATFEKEENRYDYMAVVKACQEVNLKFFFQDLSSNLAAVMEVFVPKDSQKQP